MRLDGDAPQAERAAEGTAAFAARFEDLPADRRCTPVVRVLLDDGTSQSARGDDFAVGAPPQAPAITIVRANFQEHIRAGRIALQRAPCVPGLGACDAPFNALYLPPRPRRLRPAQSGGLGSLVPRPREDPWR